jgi:hypothetical protein
MKVSSATIGASPYRHLVCACSVMLFFTALTGCTSMFEKCVGVLYRLQSDSDRVVFSQCALYSPEGLIKSKLNNGQVISVFGKLERRADHQIYLLGTNVVCDFQSTFSQELPKTVVVLRGMRLFTKAQYAMRHCIWFDPFSRDTDHSFEAHAVDVMQTRHLDSYSLDDWHRDQQR